MRNLIGVSVASLFVLSSACSNEPAQQPIVVDPTPLAAALDGTPDSVSSQWGAQLSSHLTADQIQHLGDINWQMVADDPESFLNDPIVKAAFEAIVAASPALDPSSSSTHEEAVAALSASAAKVAEELLARGAITPTINSVPGATISQIFGVDDVVIVAAVAAVYACSLMCPVIYDHVNAEWQGVKNTLGSFASGDGGPGLCACATNDFGECRCMPANCGTCQ